MERVTEPDSVEEILDDRDRLVERGEDRDEYLAEWIGPHGLRFQDALDRVVKHGGSLRGLSDHDRARSCRNRQPHTGLRRPLPARLYTRAPRHAAPPSPPPAP